MDGQTLNLRVHRSCMTKRFIFRHPRLLLSLALVLVVPLPFFACVHLQHGLLPHKLLLTCGLQLGVKILHLIIAGSIHFQQSCLPWCSEWFQQWYTRSRGLLWGWHRSCKVSLRPQGKEGLPGRAGRGELCQWLLSGTVVGER